VVFVKVKVGVPAATPVTKPASVTVAKAVLLLAHVPPVVGDKLVVAPTQIAVAPVIETEPLIVTADVVFRHPVVVFVKVKVGVPVATPVTTPASVTVAKAVLLLAHVPPVVGDKLVVVPTHIAVAPVIETIGKALIVIADVVF
jgi:uncharacterized iron-regulated membrane protein